MKEATDSAGRPSVFVGFLRDEDRPSDIIPVQSLAQMTSLVSERAIAKYKKIDFGE
jgi:hypothetical protein